MAMALVIDDGFAIRRRLRHTLERVGHNVQDAGFWAMELGGGYHPRIR